MKLKNKLIVVLLILSATLCNCTVVFHEMLMGIVGSGNYSYYSLSQQGTVIIILHSYEGDADLYISQKVLKPTFDIDNHDLQSVTCGVDHIEVPSHFHRPLSIAVYGHPSHELSSYELQVIVHDEPLQSEDEYPTSSNGYFEGEDPSMSSSIKSVPMPHMKADSITEEESILWTIFVSILKILLDVLVD